MIQHRRNKKRPFVILVYYVLLLVIVGLFILFLFQTGIFRLFSRMPFISPIPSTIVSVKGISFFSNNDPVSQVKELAKQKNIQVANIEKTSDFSYKMILITGEEIYISSQKPFVSQISSLQLVLSRLTIEGKRIATLDLRFEKPVVVFK